ncbi:hypothetical protein [Rhizobium sp. ZW T2_16]|uniref:hypothetical protein n=1 Tax=Rhizobium sp. ZW T2_16 TaxID=3378083 RepID=UPI003852B5A5
MRRNAKLGTARLSAKPPAMLREIKTSELSIVAQHGEKRTSERKFSFQPFEDVPLIMESTTQIWRDLLQSKTPLTLKAASSHLRDLSDYINYYHALTGSYVSSAKQIELIFCHLAVDFFEGKRGRVNRLRGFRRLMRSIGVDQKLLPIVPWDEQQPDARELIDPAIARKAMSAAKNEIRVIHRRLKEAATLSKTGHDPRRDSGGKLGDWQKPVCRYWIMENVFRFEIRNYDELRFERGLNSELRRLENQPAAEITKADGSVTRQTGWLGHLRWRYPFAGDIAPFFIAILLRGTINASTLASLVVSKPWHVPCPLNLGANASDEFVYILFNKTRGRQKAKKRPKVIRIISSKTNWSHPFQLLEFLKVLTQPLRSEIRRRIRELQGMSRLSEVDEAELSTLVEIKDDLFIFKTEQQITSLARMTNAGKMPKPIRDALERYGLPTDTRYLRDVGLANAAFSGSGIDLLMMRLVAQHTNRSSAEIYARRQKLILKQEAMASSCFENSVALIRSRNFSSAALRAELTAQGFNGDETESLLSEDNTTRYGNGCATPTAPPEGFDDGNLHGSPCWSQNCIDGCPSARWFEASLPSIITELKRSEEQLANTPPDSHLLSTLPSRIKRLKTLVALWPADKVEEVTLSLGIN